MNKILLILSILVLSINMQAQETTFPYPFAHNGIWGVVDDNRQELVKPSFEKINLFWHSRSLAESAVAHQGNKVGLINRKGEWLIAPKMDSIAYGSYNNDFIYRVEKNNKWGAILIKDGKAKWIVKPKYQEIFMFEGRTEELAVVTSRKGKGVVNAKGKLILDCKYVRASVDYGYMDEPIIEVTDADGQVSYWDYQGNNLSDEQLEELIGDEMDMVFEDVSVEEEPPSMAPSITYSTGEKGATILNYQADHRKESVIIPAEHKVEKVETTNHFVPQIKCIKLSKDGQLGFMNPAGEIITPVVYDRMEWEKYLNYVLLYKDDKVGMANYLGERLFPAVFTSIVRENQWQFRLDHMDGYIGYGNTKGQIFLPNYVSLEEK